MKYPEIVRYPVLAERMRFLGINKKVVAVHIGHPYGLLVKKINGEKQMDVGTSIKIAHLLGRSV